MKKLSQWLVGLLVVQFVLGMFANAYSTIPADKPYEVFRQVGFIAPHAINGVLLLILAIVFVVKAYKQKQQLATAWGGLAGILIAFTAGELFVFTQNDAWSIVMALAFLGAFARYLVATKELPNN